MSRHINLTITEYSGDNDGLTAAVWGAEPDYSIYIDKDAPQLQQAAAFLHEMLHIYHNDSSDPRPLEVIEQDRKIELWQIARLLLAE